MSADRQLVVRVVGPPFAGQPIQGGSAPEAGTLLEVFDDGTVSAYSGKVEYGQGIRDGFARMIAPVFAMEARNIDVILGDTARVPWDRGTTGSASTRTVGMQLVRAARGARDELLRRASDLLNVPVSDLSITFDSGLVVSSDGLHLVSIGELVNGSSTEVVISGEEDDSPVAAEQADRKIDQEGSIRVDAEDRVTGRAKYAHDFLMDGLAFGRIIRPPSTGATLVRLDAARAEQVPGFIQLVQTPELVGVVAETQEAADRAASFVRTSWSDPGDDVSDWNLPAVLKDRASEPVVLRDDGDVAKGLDAADRVVSGVYFAPYVANAQMEPSASTAEWDDDGRLTVWCGNRAPFTERQTLADQLGVGTESIRVIVQEVGGSFGTKSQSVSFEAAVLAREVGRPVKVAYSRDEEFATSTMRPAALMEINAGIDADGRLVAWDYVSFHAGDNAFRGRRGADSPYDAPSTRIRVADSPSPLAHGSYRSLGGAVNHFSREVHIDVIARELEADPLDFRLSNLSHPRYRRVLEEVADMSGWKSRTKSEGTGFGLAVGFDAGSYVAQVARVRVEGSTVMVERVDVAFDCGQVFNPDGVRNQVEGSVVMGMGTALWEAVEFDGGRVLNTGFGAYRVPRITDVPEINVRIIDDASNGPTGAGEPGIVPIAAAIVNAVADATGVSLDRLPVLGQL